MYIAYDSDVMTNQKVHPALADIGLYTQGKGADVRYPTVTLIAPEPERPCHPGTTSRPGMSD